MRRLAIAILGFLALISGPAQAAGASTSWRITRTEWTEADEKGFGDFVRAIA
jgi:hypothetical protein